MTGWGRKEKCVCVHVRKKEKGGGKEKGREEEKQTSVLVQTVTGIRRHLFLQWSLIPGMAILQLEPQSKVMS